MITVLPRLIVPPLLELAGFVSRGDLATLWSILLHLWAH